MPSERHPDDSTPQGWTPLENRLYRRDVVYDKPSWNVQPYHFSSALLAAAPCAGPIALVPDAGWGLSCALEIYMLSGDLIKRFDRLREKTKTPNKAVALGWSTSDLLTIVYNDGTIIRLPGGVHSDRMRFIRAFASDAEERVFDAAILRNGQVILRGQTGILYKISAEDKVEHEIEVIKPPEGIVREFPNAGITVAERQSGSQGSFDVLSITENGNLAVLNSTGLFVLPGDQEASEVCVSPNGQYVAVMESKSGHLFVSTVDLSSIIARVNLVDELSSLENIVTDVDFDARAPESIAWVGSDAIAVLYKEHLVLIGPHSGVAVLNLGEGHAKAGAILYSEIDGLRLASPFSVEFIQMVPDPVQSVRCRKQAPGYKLLKCSSPIGPTSNTIPVDALLRYRLLRELRDSGTLLDASRSCISAAYLESDVQEQKRLLHAAVYGQKHAAVFLNNDADISKNPSETERVKGKRTGESSTKSGYKTVPVAIAILRVLQATRDLACGVPLSKPQFDYLGLPALVARLARCGRHTLALKLSTFGRISPYEVLSEWAVAAIYKNVNETDDALTKLIIGKFEAVGRSYKGSDLHGSRRGRALPYVVAAETANVLGRQKCAELLLRRETRPAPKVDMYLKMGREAQAIIAAVSSGDPELVLGSIVSVLERKDRSIRETAKLLRSLPPALGNRATDLFASHLKQIGDYSALRMVYLEAGRRREAALVEIYLADQVPDTTERVKALEKTTLTITRGYSRRSCYFEGQAVQHAAIAASNSIELEKIARMEKGSLRNAQDGDLLAHAILDIQDKKQRQNTLTKLRKQLKIPDRRFFWICLDSMAEAGDFESIKALSNSAGQGRAPPIGLTAFVDTCIKHKMDDEAVKYALRITDLRERARALARCGRGREAADIASRLRNQQLLEEVQDLAARHVAYITIPLAGSDRLNSIK